MTPQLVQIAIGLIGALLGIAVTWGSQRRTVDQLTEAVKELTKKIELIAAALRLVGTLGLYRSLLRGCS